ncbi:MAG: twin-arginine translocase TatA/TatE family subunit [Ignavibacteriae bacterium]|nr:twin-arginine translocase TatA/TatE family subunit [Ignavibacteriota bacterium]
MFDIGGGELLLIVLAVIVFFGPKKLPEVANMVGKGMRKVRQAQAQFQSQIQNLEQEIKSSAYFEDESVNQNNKTNNTKPDSNDKNYSG